MRRGRAGTEIESVVSQCGIVLPPEDIAELGAAILRLADDVATWLELGRWARAYAEANFERDAVLRRFFGPIEDNASAVVNDFVV